MLEEDQDNDVWMATESVDQTQFVAKPNAKPVNKSVSVGKPLDKPLGQPLGKPLGMPKQATSPPALDLLAYLLDVSGGPEHRQDVVANARLIWQKVLDIYIDMPAFVRLVMDQVFMQA